MCVGLWKCGLFKDSWSFAYLPDTSSAYQPQGWVVTECLTSEPLVCKQQQAPSCCSQHTGLWEGRRSLDKRNSAWWSLTCRFWDTSHFWNSVSCWKPGTGIASIMLKPVYSHFEVHSHLQSRAGTMCVAGMQCGHSRGGWNTLGKSSKNREDEHTTSGNPNPKTSTCLIFSYLLSQ